MRPFPCLNRPSSSPSITRIAVCLATLTAAATLCAPAGIAQATERDVDSLRARIVSRAAQLPGAQIGVALHDLASGLRLEINGDTVFHAASTMKVPVLIDLLREVDAERLNLDQSLLLVNAFHSIVDGSPYSLDSTDDSDSLVFARVGDFVPIRWLAERMITHSSNLATNALIAILDPARITNTMKTFGARNTQVLRGVEDALAYQAGRNNQTTANDLAAILVALEREGAASSGATRIMREIMLRQEFNNQIPAGLPPGTPVAHKTGWITATLHDAAIVYPTSRKPFVLVVLTRGIRERQAAEALTSDIAELVWSALVPTTP